MKIKRSVLQMGLTASMILPAPAAVMAQQDDRIEEVVVTGSLIGRTDNFDTVSPVDTIDSDSISEQGTPNIGEVIRNTTFNYGVASVTNILAATAQGGASPSANLRGLGSGATLTVIDGRRSTSQNLSNLYPQIAVQRIETLTDGGGAIYGTDAIGGVVNVIPRRYFEGLEVRMSNNAVTDGDWNELTWSVMGGVDNGTTSFTGAFEYRDRAQMKFMDRPEFALGAPSFSTTASPGTATVPTRDEDGNIVGQSTQVDPGCGVNNDPDGTKAEVGGFQQGKNVFGSSCGMEFGANFDYIAPSEQFTGAFFFDHDFSDYLSFESEVLLGSQTVAGRGSPQNPGGRVSELPTVPGENPGNPFRATNSEGELLYAQPRRDSQGDLVTDDLGRYVPARDESGNVILAQNQFTPMDNDPQGGIAFNEDVRLAGWRPPQYPNNQPTRNRPDGSGIGDGDFESYKYRWVGQLNFEVPDTTWGGYASYTHDRVVTENPERRERLSALSAGLQGDLVVAADGADGSRTAWFNPFSTMNYTCVEGVCDGSVEGSGEVQTDPNANNPLEVIDQIQLVDMDRETTKFNIVDLVMSGEMFTIGDRVIDGAVGGQWRNINFEQDRGPVFASQDAWIGNGAPGWDSERDIYAAFGEVSVPVWEYAELGGFDMGVLEFNGAVRHEIVEDDSESDLDSTTAKLGLRWEARDWLALRASYNEAFITPSMEQLFAPQTTGINNATDRFTGDSFFMARSLGGTPTLEPEEAEIINLGFTVDMMQGDMTFSLDWKDFDFTNRIVRLLPQDVLDADYADFQQWSANNNPDATLADWTASGLADPNIERDPNSQIVSQIVTPLVNAAAMTWKGFDTSWTYRFLAEDLPFIDGPMGEFNMSVTGTYMDEFNSRASADSAIVKGAGNRNNATGFLPPAPRLRANARLGWSMDNHRLSLAGRFTDGVRNPASGEPFGSVNPAVLDLMGVTNPMRDIPSHTEWDVNYQVSFDDLLGDRRSTFELGLINAFDNEPPAIRTLGGLETFLHDPRRRIWYVKVAQEL